MSCMTAVTGMSASLFVVGCCVSANTWNSLAFTIHASCAGIGVFVEAQEAWMYKRLSAAQWSKLVTILAGGVVAGAIVDLGRHALASKITG